MAWIFLAAAVVGNILANVFFKQAMASFPAERTLDTLFTFAFNPFLWIGGVCAGTMLAFYLLAIHAAGLAFSYAFVTSLSLVGITLVATFTFKEPVSLQAALGIGLVIGGIYLISSANQATHAVADSGRAEIASTR